MFVSSHMTKSEGNLEKSGKKVLILLPVFLFCKRKIKKVIKKLDK